MEHSMFNRAVALTMGLLFRTFSVKGVTGQGPGPDQGNVSPGM